MVRAFPRRDKTTICAAGKAHTITRISGFPRTFLVKNTVSADERRFCEYQADQHSHGPERALKLLDVALGVQKGASEGIQSCNSV